MKASGWSYNVGVATPAPQAQRDSAQSTRRPNPHIYDLEATGILVIAVLIFILTLVRYWHHIPWGSR